MNEVRLCASSWGAPCSPPWRSGIRGPAAPSGSVRVATRALLWTSTTFCLSPGFSGRPCAFRALAPAQQNYCLLMLGTQTPSQWSAACLPAKLRLCIDLWHCIALRRVSLVSAKVG